MVGEGEEPEATWPVLRQSRDVTSTQGMCQGPCGPWAWRGWGHIFVGSPCSNDLIPVLYT